MKNITHKTDLCIIGGGLAGVCASIAAARHSLNVVLMHDRPVLGGNASSEIRMHICGADRSDGSGLRESGIIEEIELENIYHNPHKNYSIWDMVLFSKIKEHKNIELLLNCSCNQAKTEANKIISIEGWQGTSETHHTVIADLFADCSGDSILAELSNADYRIGREAASEFNESIEPVKADSSTMGLSCLIQVRKHDHKIEYKPLEYANEKKYDFDKLMITRGRGHIDKCTNFWWLELGGQADSIHDTDRLRDDLVGLAASVWDYIKNKADYEADNYSLEWIGFLPGKRESRRCVGDYILNQNDIQSQKHFVDAIGYGGWSIDDHVPEGFLFEGKPTTYHDACQPYEIPFRCLYSINISNLMFAGRNISATHAAMSSTRVMGTCAILGQAVGTAASLAVKNNISPRQVYLGNIKDLQQILLQDGCYIPSIKKDIPKLTLEGKFSGIGSNFENLLNKAERNLDDTNHCNGSLLDISWDKPIFVRKLRVVFDSELERTEKNMPFLWDVPLFDRKMPKRLVKDFDISFKENGSWVKIHEIRENHKRLVTLQVMHNCDCIRIDNIKTWDDSKDCNIFSFEVV